MFYGDLQPLREVLRYMPIDCPYYYLPIFGEWRQFHWELRVWGWRAFRFIMPVGQPCLLIAIPLQNTLGEPSALAGVLQWVTSLSPILVTDGIPVSLAPVICR